MYSLNSFFTLLDKIAPLKYSEMQVEKGSYDNSGILVRTHDFVNNALFSLDLSAEAVKKAKHLKCDTVVTHHPAIYHPIKALSVEGETAPVAEALLNGLNVISMHLNLDVADGGIDCCLCKGLGGEEYKVIDAVCDGVGYGREFYVGKTLSEFKKGIRKTFGTRRTVSYGNPKRQIELAASFCGGGTEYALAYVRNGGKADAIVTSDVPHHALKEIVESGKAVVTMTHYSAENYGFKAFYERVKSELSAHIGVFFFEDKRFL